MPVNSFRHEDKRVNIPTADSEELLNEEAARPGQWYSAARPVAGPAAGLEGKGRAGSRGPGRRRAADLHPGEDRPAGDHREPAPRQRPGAARPVRRLRRPVRLRSSRVLPARGQLVQPDDPRRLAAGHGLPRGEGEPPRQGPDDLSRPALRDQVRLQLAGRRPARATSGTARSRTPPARSSRSRRSATPGNSASTPISPTCATASQSPATCSPTPAASSSRSATRMSTWSGASLTRSSVARTSSRRSRFSKTAGQTAQFISGTVDYILWYAHKIEDNKISRPLRRPRQLGGRGADKYDQVELPDGRRMTAAAAES